MATSRSRSRIVHASTRLAAGLVAALTLAAAVPSSAIAESFAVLSYNVHGLPPIPFITKDRENEMRKIVTKLEDFHTPEPPYVGTQSVVGLQEAFYDHYYDILTDPGTVTYPYVTPKDHGGEVNIGDGLTTLSDFALEGLLRVQWETCNGSDGSNGSDCDTNKGFTYARVVLDGNASFDLYNFHADAGQGNNDQLARRSNINQLVAAIGEMSPPGTAVIVVGDGNAFYTRETDNIENLLTGAGLKDVWIQLVRGGLVPEKGPDIESDCETEPASANCELKDKIFYRDGTQVVLAPQSYTVLEDMFSDEDGDLSDHFPIAVTFDFAFVTTTTVTSTSTSSSTTIPDRPCGDPVDSFQASAGSRAVVAGDALFVLKVAVGTFECPLCTCDVNNNMGVSATDALIVLKKAVGQDIALVCPPCE